ncbi:MAG: phage tail protein [Ruminococcus sp.]|nr:phage tail protein [Ruminococcus sp.]
MDNIRIAILNAYDRVCTFLDNRPPKALHYYDDELHEYLKGAANTYTFKADAHHEDSVYLTEGNKLAFRYRNRDYYFNIMQVFRDEDVVEVEAYSLNFELLNEQKEVYKATGAMTFEQYLNVFDYEKVITLGNNEVSHKSIKHEWTGTDTMLARIFSLASIFDAEIEFIPQLNEDYSLGRIVMNVYQEHNDNVQGIGISRTDTVLRFGKELSGVKRTSNISDLYTAIRPIGRDGLTVSGLNKIEYDADGKVEFTSPSGNRNIYAVQARDRFPSNLMANANERYIAQMWNYDTDNVNVLYAQALAELKRNCIPQVKYEVDGYYDTGIGDTVSIADEGFNPPLYLEARVTEQIRSFTDPSRNKTVFDNFKELQSEIDPTLLAAMNKLIESNKTYTCTILTDNGIVFKNGQGSTALTASVMDGGKDVTNSLTIHWKKDGADLSTGKSITVNAADISAKAVYRYEAVDATGGVRGAHEVTVSDLEDGKTQYLHVKYSNDGGDTFTGNNGEDPGKWMGYYVDFMQADSDNPNMYNWVKVEGPQGTQGPQGEKGNSGGKGDKGDPMGILELPEEPQTKYEGMLWKNTGTVSGFTRDTVYIWENSTWKTFQFSAKNIKADTFEGYEFNGSIFKSEFDFIKSNGHRVVGNSQMSDGEIKIDSVESINLGGGTIAQLLLAVLRYNGISISSMGQLYGQHDTRVTDRSIEFSNAFMKTMLYDNGLSIESIDANPKLSVIGPGGISLIDSSGSANISPSTFNGKAPTNHASSGTGYGVGTTANYGHVKTRNDLNASSYVQGEALSAYQGYLLNTKINSLGKPIVKAGTKVITANNGGTSMLAFTNAQLNSLLGVNNSSNTNTVCCFCNGDAAACGAHFAASYVPEDGGWRVVTPKGNFTNGSPFRLNYTVTYFG